ATGMVTASTPLSPRAIPRPAPAAPPAAPAARPTMARGSRRASFAPIAMRSRRSPRRVFWGVAGLVFAAVLAGILVVVLAGPPGPAAPGARSPAAAPRRPGAGGGAAAASPVTELSRGCPGRNAEVTAAAAPPRLVYAAWIGCGGIGFARSADGGLHFSPPRLVRGSGNRSWDPSIAVAPDGTLYVAFMHQQGHYSYPVVAASA